MERARVRSNVAVNQAGLDFSVKLRFARKDAAENTAVVVVREHVGVAWVGQVRIAPNASLILVAYTDPVNGHGSADASLDGRVIYATRS